MTLNHQCSFDQYFTSLCLSQRADDLSLTVTITVSFVSNDPNSLQCFDLASNSNLVLKEEFCCLIDLLTMSSSKMT